VTVSKSGKPRHIYLTDEGQAFFDNAKGMASGNRRPRCPVEPPAPL